MNQHANSFNAVGKLAVGDRSYSYVRLAALQDAGLTTLDRLPYSLKILLENLVRFEDGRSVTKDDVDTRSASRTLRSSGRSTSPARRWPRRL